MDLRRQHPKAQPFVPNYPSWQYIIALVHNLTSIIAESLRKHRGEQRKEVWSD
jgi:hypothetical protein